MTELEDMEIEQVEAMNRALDAWHAAQPRPKKGGH